MPSGVYVRTKSHSAETRAKIGAAASKTRIAELKPCPHGCEGSFNNGSLARHLTKVHEFLCRVDECPETIHKARGLCLPHWSIDVLVAKYGLTVEDYLDVYSAQDGRCAICRRQMKMHRSPGTKRQDHLYADHDHATGAFRGLLCFHCNLMIGHARDNVDTLANAIEYLKR